MLDTPPSSKIAPKATKGIFTENGDCFRVEAYCLFYPGKHAFIFACSVISMKITFWVTTHLCLQLHHYLLTLSCPHPCQASPAWQFLPPMPLLSKLIRAHCLPYWLYIFRVTSFTHPSNYSAPSLLSLSFAAHHEHKHAADPSSCLPSAAPAQHPPAALPPPLHTNTMAAHFNTCAAMPCPQI